MIWVDLAAAFVGFAMGSFGMALWFKHHGRKVLRHESWLTTPVENPDLVLTAPIPSFIPPWHGPWTEFFGGPWDTEMKQWRWPATRYVITFEGSYELRHTKRGFEAHWTPEPDPPGPPTLTDR